MTMSFFTFFDSDPPPYLLYVYECFSHFATKYKVIIFDDIDWKYHNTYEHFPLFFLYKIELVHDNEFFYIFLTRSLI